MLGKFVCTLFSWEDQGHFWGDKDQISSGEGKRKGKKGYGGESQNEGYFATFPLFSKIQTFISQTVGQTTSNHHHCDQHVQKPIYRDFQVI